MSAEKANEFFPINGPNVNGAGVFECRSFSECEEWWRRLLPVLWDGSQTIICMPYLITDRGTLHHKPGVPYVLQNDVRRGAPRVEMSDPTWAKETGVSDGRDDLWQLDCCSRAVREAMTLPESGEAVIEAYVVYLLVPHEVRFLVPDMAFLAHTIYLEMAHTALTASRTASAAIEAARDALGGAIHDLPHRLEMIQVALRGEPADTKRALALTARFASWLRVVGDLLSESRGDLSARCEAAGKLCSVELEECISEALRTSVFGQFWYEFGDVLRYRTQPRRSRDELAPELDADPRRTLERMGLLSWEFQSDAKFLMTETMGFVMDLICEEMLTNALKRAGGLVLDPAAARIAVKGGYDATGDFVRIVIENTYLRGEGSLPHFWTGREVSFGVRLARHLLRALGSPTVDRDAPREPIPVGSEGAKVWTLQVELLFPTTYFERTGVKANGKETVATAGGGQPLS
jgi:hypothetical protein